eukprot:14448259-Alexandrium_andersonii.AAC.1
MAAAGGDDAHPERALGRPPKFKGAAAEWPVRRLESGGSRAPAVSGAARRRRRRTGACSDGGQGRQAGLLRLGDAL